MCGLAGTNNESGQDLQPLLMVVGAARVDRGRHEAQSHGHPGNAWAESPPTRHTVVRVSRP